jgi:hypothetical protein
MESQCRFGGPLREKPLDDMLLMTQLIKYSKMQALANGRGDESDEFWKSEIPDLEELCDLLPFYVRRPEI